MSPEYTLYVKLVLPDVATAKRSAKTIANAFGVDSVVVITPEASTFTIRGTQSAFTQYLIESIEQSGLTAFQVAQRAGLSKATLSQLRHGRIPGITDEAVSQIATGLGWDQEDPRTQRLIDLAREQRPLGSTNRRKRRLALQNPLK